jgi:hypothetical protein
MSGLKESLRGGRAGRGIVSLSAIYAVIRRVWKGSAIQIIPAIFKAWAISADFGKLYRNQRAMGFPD